MLFVQNCNCNSYRSGYYWTTDRIVGPQRASLHNGTSIILDVTICLRHWAYGKTYFLSLLNCQATRNRVLFFISSCKRMYAPRFCQAALRSLWRKRIARGSLNLHLVVNKGWKIRKGTRSKLRLKVVIPNVRDTRGRVWKFETTRSTMLLMIINNSLASSR